MSRPVLLSRADFRTWLDRGTGALTLRYTGRKLRFHERLYGYDEGVMFAVVVSEVPLPEALISLATSAGVDLLAQPLVPELRRAVADALVAEAMMHAPTHLATMASPGTAWLETDVQSMERSWLMVEGRIRDITRTIEQQLISRTRRGAFMSSWTPSPLFDPMPPPFYGRSLATRTRSLPTPPAPAPEIARVDVIDVDVKDDAEPTPVETSEATGRRAMAAAKTAREQEMPQRLPGGVRKALGRLPAGIYLSHGALLGRKSDICSAMVDGAEAGRRSSEATVIDWDGEWPVVVRRYGEHGRIVYRVEDALRRHGIAPGEAA